MGELMRAQDWTQTSIGNPGEWPESLQSSVAISLNSGFPIAIYWGNDFTLLYNDAWSSIPGDKHPWALGRPGAVVWPEIWSGLQEEFQSVLDRGASYRRPDALLLMQRYGYTEECYFDYTLSPITDRNGNVGGVFNAVIETTYRVINDRRQGVLEQFQQQLNKAKSFQDSIYLVNKLLSKSREDIPFFALFTADVSGELSLKCSAGIACKRKEHLEALFQQVIKDEKAILINNLKNITNKEIDNIYPEQCTEAALVPISSKGTKINGCILLGISSRKRFDEDYTQFFTALGLHIGTILNNGNNVDIERSNLTRLLEGERRFRDLIHQAPVAVLVFRGNQFTIAEANNMALELAGKGNDIINKPLLEAFPELGDQPVMDILREVYYDSKPYYGASVPVTIVKDNVPEVRYFDFSYTPLLEDGKTVGVLEVATEVTQLVRERENAEDKAQDITTMVMTAKYALMILRGRDWQIEIANEEIAKLWGKSLSNITGKKLMDVLPELEGQPFPALLTKVYNSGYGYGQEEEVFYLETDEGRVAKYVSFHYEPMRDSKGEVCGIIVSCHDITNIVNSRRLLEESYEEQQTLNEELTATNEELASANEELNTMNEELEVTQESLHQSIEELARSESKFRKMVHNAPVAIAILAGEELVIETANALTLKLWGKTEDVLGKKIINAIPELEGQPYLDIIADIFKTKQPYYGNNAKAYLMQDGQLVERYFDFIYQPLLGEHDDVVSIISVGTDVTAQVESRTELEKAKDTLSLSIQAAELGTFDLDIDNNLLHWDERCRKLFGINHQEEVEYERDFVNNLHPDDRHRITDLIANYVYNKGLSDGNYDVEYRIIDTNDKRVRWIRAKGKTYFNEQEEPLRFIGAVLDITEQKQDEIRKNDFIGMVSHELKTPLTSLNGYIQMMQSKAEKLADPFFHTGLVKVNKQVKRMSAMINGFLNLSRLESGRIQIIKQDFDLSLLLKEMVEENEFILPHHRLILQTAGVLNISADRDKIGSVISNLIGNAGKYSAKGKSITVASEVAEGCVRVSVKDEGVGIKQEDRERLFERFYRVDNPDHKHVSGFGIGLYLSAEIIKQHQGEIWVESEVNKGSTFYFCLPLGALIIKEAAGESEAVSL